MNRAASSTFNLTATARVYGLETDSSAIRAPDAVAARRIAARAAVALAALARFGCAPLTLLLGHPADPASTSSSDGSPNAAERSRYVPPTTRASHAGRGAPCDVRSFTPPAADTICSFESCEEPRADRIPRTRARSADVPPTMRVVGEAPAEAATQARTTATSTADAGARTRPSVLPSARGVRPGASSRGWARRSGRCRVRGRSRPGRGRPRRRTVRSRGSPSPSTPPTPPPCR